MKKIKIAIFEDDKIDGFIYDQLLKRHDEKLEFSIFNNIEKGIEQVKQMEFDIILIELHFWGQNLGGLAILKKIKEVCSANVIFVALTSLLQDKDLEEIMKAGFSMCLEKPVSSADISDWIKIPSQINFSE
jgi:CheY-like chemotaxis protein